jgi:hypothetical protein
VTGGVCRFENVVTPERVLKIIVNKVAIRENRKSGKLARDREAVRSGRRST